MSENDPQVDRLNHLRGEVARIEASKKRLDFALQTRQETIRRLESQRTPQGETSAARPSSK